MSTTDSGADGGRPASNPLARTPSDWVVRFAARLRPGARVLDVACGHGRHARYLAGLGCRVTAVDSDPACGQSLAGAASIDFLLADLEDGPWPFDDRSFDAIVVIHYLHRPLLPKLVAALAPEGLLVYETFATGNERFGRPRNPDHLLHARELLDAFAHLRVLAFEDGYVERPAAAMVQRIAALKVEPTRALAVESLRL